MRLTTKVPLTTCISFKYKVRINGSIFTIRIKEEASLSIDKSCKCLHNDQEGVDEASSTASSEQEVDDVSTSMEKRNNGHWDANGESDSWDSPMGIVSRFARL